MTNLQPAGHSNSAPKQMQQTQELSDNNDVIQWVCIPAYRMMIAAARRGKKAAPAGKAHPESERSLFAQPPAD